MLCDEDDFQPLITRARADQLDPHPALRADLSHYVGEVDQSCHALIILTAFVLFTARIVSSMPRGEPCGIFSE
jgi:hypothetical protein